MTDDLGSEICSRLKDLGPSISVAMEIHFDSYFDAVRGLVDNFSNSKDMECIYITSSIPATTIMEALRTLEVDTGKIHFIDCLSHMLMGNIDSDEKIIYIESPTMLENIILKVEFLMRKSGGVPTTVVMDSIDSLAIHNDSKILSEFLQIFLGGLRSRETYPVVLSMVEQSKPEIREMVELVCDQVISFNEGTE